MALDISPANMHRLVLEALQEREQFLKPIRLMRRRYVGNYYRGDPRGEPMPQNYLTSWIASTLGRVAFSNPSLRVTSRIGRVAAGQAKLIQEMLNAWIRATNWVEHGLARALDLMFGYSPAMVLLADAPPAQASDFVLDGLQRPRSVRLAPERFFWDPEAEAFAACRYVGHVYQMDIDDVQVNEIFDPAVAGELQAADEPALDTGLERPRRQTPRRRVTLWDVYIPEQRVIFTLSPHTAGYRYLRPPTPYEGHPAGPYVLGGVFPVPGSVPALSPIAQAFEQFEAANRAERAALKEAATLKNLILHGIADPKAQAAIRLADTNSLVYVPGFTPALAQQYTVGGVSAERLRWIEQLVARAENQIGSNAVNRGNLPATKQTATAVSAAVAANEERGDFIAARFTQTAMDEFRRVGWLLFHAPTAVQAVAPAGQDGPSYLAFGGPEPGLEWLAFDEHFEVQVDPNSMRRVDPLVQGQRAIEMFDLLVSRVVPAMQQFPWLRWPDILDDLGEAMNIPDFAQRVMSPEQPQAAGPAGINQPGPVMPAGQIPQPAQA